MSAGISFNNLSITKKIHAITCIAITAFVIIVVTNFIVMNDNKISLDELEKSSYQVVKLTSANVALLEKLDELYTQAVTFGESGLVDSAAQTYKTINENLQNIISINDSYVHADTKKQLELYAQTSWSIATSMIDGTADFSKIQQQAGLLGDMAGIAHLGGLDKAISILIGAVIIRATILASQAFLTKAS